MSHEYCKIFHFDQSAIASTLTLLELDPQHNHLAEQLQKTIIKPHLDAIIDKFYHDYILVHEPEGQPGPIFAITGY